jgi:CRISPR system Cascade subunit CasB
VLNDEVILKNAEDLVREVRKLIAANPADRAALRHSLGHAPEDVALDVHRIVVPHLPKKHLDSAAERAFYAVPAYMAAQSRDARDEEAANGTHEARAAGPQNLGESLARAVHTKGLNEKSVEPRLQMLARQDLDGLYRQLPRLILFLRGRQVRIDWVALIRDLARWGRYPKQVAKEWMQSYYRTTERLTAQQKRGEPAGTTTEGNEDK